VSAAPPIQRPFKVGFWLPAIAADASIPRVAILDERAHLIVQQDFGFWKIRINL
jgi:hypothetical protein